MRLFKKRKVVSIEFQPSEEVKRFLESHGRAEAFLFNARLWFENSIDNFQFNVNYNFIKKIV